MAITLFKSILIPLIGWTLSIAAARALAVPVDWLGVAACIVGVFAAYQLDHLLDRRGELAPAEMQREFAIIAMAGAVLLAIAWTRPELLAAMVVLGALGVFYIPLKRVIPKNLLTASAWAVCVVSLSLDLEPFTAEYGLAAAMIFFLVLANSSLCDLPDIERDRENRVLGIVPAFGSRTGGRIAAGVACVSLAIALHLGSVAFAIPSAAFIVVGAFFAEGVAQHPQQRWLLDAVLVLPGPISFLA